MMVLREKSPTQNIQFGVRAARLYVLRLETASVESIE